MFYIKISIDIKINFYFVFVVNELFASFSGNSYWNVERAVQITQSKTEKFSFR